ncbi:MAG TPA: hypothetical protein VM662_03415, partial [Sphingomonas sp.]|nr:hypothetical protein [Sphingomonas sp.]
MEEQGVAIGGSSDDEIPVAAALREPILTPEPEPHENMGDGMRRDRLMAALALMAGLGLLLATPFAL